MIQKKSPRIWVYQILFAGIIFCAAFLSALAAGLQYARNVSLYQTEQDLRTFSMAVQAVVAEEWKKIEAADRNLTDGFRQLDGMLKDIAGFTPDFRISIVDQTGKVVADSDSPDISELENHRYREEVSEALHGGEATAVRRSTVSEKDVLYYASPVQLGGGLMALRLSMPLELNVFESSGVQKRMTVVFVLLLCLSLGCSFLISGKIIRQIHKLQRTAREYAAGNFAYRPDVFSPKELANLSFSLGQMASQIQENIASIAKSRDDFQAVFSGSTEGLVFFDSGMMVLAYNDAAAKFFDVPVDSAVGYPLIQSVRNADIQALVAKTVAGDDSGGTDEVSVQVFHTSSAYELLVRCVPIRNTQSTGKPYSFLLIATDITRLRQLEQVRKDFVANVSHELKTPVTAIKGFAETLLENPSADPAEQRRFLEIINSQTARLGDIIEDLLTLSKLDQQTALPEVMPSDLVSLLKAICTGYEKAAEKKNITLSFSAEGDVPQVEINQALFRHAMENLLDNAVKYCPPGSSVSCAVSQASGGKPAVMIAVEDSGPGIPDAYKERVFERFFRIDKGRSREQGGTGLGLSIVRHVVNIHGGTIRAADRPDGLPGARFEIILPAVRDPVMHNPVE